MVNGTAELKIKWYHHGTKHKFVFKRYEITNDDAFEILLGKIQQVEPNFNGILAHVDSNSNQVIIASNEELIELISKNRKQIRIHTLQMPRLIRYAHRSKSVPLGFGSRTGAARQLRAEYSPPPPYYKSLDTTSLSCSKQLMDLHSRVPSPSHYMLGGYTRHFIYGFPPESYMIRSLLLSPLLFDNVHSRWSRNSRCIESWNGCSRKHHHKSF